MTLIDPYNRLLFCMQMACQQALDVPDSCHNEPSALCFSIISYSVKLTQKRWPSCEI